MGSEPIMFEGWKGGEAKDAEAWGRGMRERLLLPVL